MGRECYYAAAAMYLNLQAVWVQYKLACDEVGLRAAAYNTFCMLWRKLTPHITVMKPMTDLCCVCQQNSTAINSLRRSPRYPYSLSKITHNNLPHQIVKRAEDHLLANHAGRTAELYAGPAVGADSRSSLQDMDTVPRLGSEPGTVFGK